MSLSYNLSVQRKLFEVFKMKIRGNPVLNLVMIIQRLQTLDNTEIAGRWRLYKTPRGLSFVSQKRLGDL